MNRRSTLTASGVALAVLVVWWGFTLYIDGVVLRTVPYHQYETVALLYPEIYYPALPGWALAHAQPFSWGIWVVTLGWMVLLSAAIGVSVTRYASGSETSPSIVAIGCVVGLFVAVTALEAAATLLA